MALARFEQTLQDKQGNAIPYASVEVRRHDSGLKALLKADRDGLTPRSNPITITPTDDGKLWFHALGGVHRIITTIPGHDPVERTYVGIGTGSEVDADTFANAGYTFVSETATAVPPTATGMRFDNADVSLATHAYVSKATLGAANVNGWLNGFLDDYELMVTSGDGKEASWTVKGATDHTDYVDIELDPLTYAGPAGPFSFGNATTLTLARGSVGPIGPTGRAAAFAFKFDQGINGNPGAGHFGLNNVTVASATNLRFSETDGDGAGISAFLTTLDDSTTTSARCLVLLRKVGTPATFAAFMITSAITDSGAYDSFTVSHIASNGTFSDEDDFTAEFYRTGDKGEQGNAGNTGPTGATPGYRLIFSTTTTDSDPGAGNVRANNAVFGSITQLFIDNSDAGGNTITTWLDGLDDVNNASARASLRLQKIDDPTVYAEFAVVGAVVDGTGYRKVPVLPVAGALPANGMTLVAVASKSGADGAGDMSSAAYPDVVAIEALSGTGLIARTGSGSAATRSIAVTASTGLSISNGNGVSGDPTLAGVDATTSAKGVVELATSAEFRTATDAARALGVAETWGAAAYVALTDAATIATDFSTFLSLASCALGGNRALGNPSNEKPGQFFVFKFTAVTSTRTLTPHADYVLGVGVEAGPWSITTSETLLVCGFVDAPSVLRVTAVIRF